jgi:hypothetical protein
MGVEEHLGNAEGIGVASPKGSSGGATTTTNCPARTAFPTSDRPHGGVSRPKDRSVTER